MRVMSAALAASLVVVLSPVGWAQSPQISASPSVPRLISINGVFHPADGNPPARVEEVTLAIYAEENGGPPLWQETQSVEVDVLGRYALMLGATEADGVPLDVFASGEARWLGMVWARPGEMEGARTRFTSVPYALRASDAETLGGRPASAYVLAPSAGGEGGGTGTGATAGTVISPIVNPGTTNFLAKYVNTNDVGPSAVIDTGGLIGINTPTPFDVLHARFTNTNGTMTGLAVQNLGSTSNSFSGMLFFDQNGALGQFQGFNNSTHEYRINNIASGGTINFMTGGTSRFLVTNGGDIGIGTTTPTADLAVQRSDSSGNIAATGIHSFPTVAGGGFIGRRARGTAAAPSAILNSDIIVQLVGTGYDGNSFSNGASVNFRAAENWTDTAHGTNIQFTTTAIGTTGTVTRMTIQADGDVGIGDSSPADKLQVVGDIRVGTSGTNGCIKRFDGTGIAGACSSDGRFKKDIAPFGPTLGSVTALQPVHYYWRAAEFPDRHFGNGLAYGLIAQEVEAVLPELVVTDDEGYKAVDYSKLPLLAIQAIKELKAESDAVRAQNDALKTRVDELERMVKALLATTRQ